MGFIIFAEQLPFREINPIIDEINPPMANAQTGAETGSTKADKKPYIKGLNIEK